MQGGAGLVRHMTRILTKLDLIGASINRMHNDIHHIFKQEKQRGEMKRIIRKIVKYFDTEDEFRYAVSDYYILNDEGESIYKLFNRVIVLIKDYSYFDACDKHTLLVFCQKVVDLIVCFYLGCMDVRNFIESYYTEFRYERVRDMHLIINLIEEDDEVNRLDKILIDNLKGLAEEAFKVKRALENRVACDIFELDDLEILLRPLTTKLRNMDHDRDIHNLESRYFDLYVSKRY